MLHISSSSVFFFVQSFFTLSPPMFHKTMSVLMSMTLISTSFASVINDDLLTRTDDLRDAISMTQYKSCELFDTALREYNNNFDNYRYFEDDMRMDDWSDDFMMEESTALDAEVWSTINGGINVAGGTSQDKGESIEFSSTNLQKTGVDEPEILKSNGKHLYYVNKQVWATLILDPITKKEIWRIALPKTLETVALFLDGEILTIIMQQYTNQTKQSFRDSSQRTFVATFNIAKAPKIALNELYVVDGYYSDARITNGELTLITTSSMNRGNDYTSIKTRQPRVVSIDKQRNIDVVTSSCDDFSALLPQESRRVPLTTITRFQTNTDSDIIMRHILSDNEVIHMSQDGLFLAHGYQKTEAFTAIHSFDSSSLKYKASNIVPWSLLTQYSLDENKGKFRIITTNNQRQNPQASTNVYVMDKNMDITGKLENIEPWEEFQGARFMGDMLYLVTFPTPRPFPRDPLFAIDMTTTNPTIVGELKIPWYSTYLHPLQKVWNKQYLLWLWYDVRDTDQRDNPIRWWLKVDVYEIDFDKKETAESKCEKIKSDEELYADCVESVDTNNVRVSQIDSNIVWWQGSRSEAMENPRLFVLKSDGTLMLPALINDIKTEERERCEIRYDKDGNEAWKECRTDRSVTGNDPQAQLLTFSVNTQWVSFTSQKNLTKNFVSGTDERSIRRQLMRAWFVDTTSYLLSQDFWYFNNGNSEEVVKFE